MDKTVLQLAYKPLRVILIIVSMYYFLRGHNSPGGGFIGALILSAGFIFQAMAVNTNSARRSMLIEPEWYIHIGLLMSIVSSIPGWIYVNTPMTGVWTTINLPLAGDIKLGTPLLFDLGVYVCVFGVVTSMSFQFLKHIKWN
ncbi:MAG: Na(+)/H(+) antiporter subunit B [Bacteroidetes bacterium]|jgi:multicomponent Na+:H+ antiporter subunit B|nr:Na(+)/H(+) antiporter subunit B [Bacteroidota bacterium]